jgi:hypothetical protein
MDSNYGLQVANIGYIFKETLAYIFGLIIEEK